VEIRNVQILHSVMMDIIVTLPPETSVEYARRTPIAQTDALIVNQPHGLHTKQAMKNALSPHATRHIAHVPRKRNIVVPSAITAIPRTAHPVARVASCQTAYTAPPPQPARPQ